jgi:hypothetical protein
MKQFNAVYPISGEDLTALPVKAIGPAVAFYQSVLGFSVMGSNEATARYSVTTCDSGLFESRTTSQGKPGRARSRWSTSTRCTGS